MCIFFNQVPLIHHNHRTLAVAQPIVVSESVKGDLDKRIAADGFHSVKSLLRDIKSVGVKLLHEHIAPIDALDDLKEMLVAHGFTARNGKGVDAARLRLVEQLLGFFKRKFAHQRRVVRGVEAMQTVIVAFARDHPVHCRKITVVNIHFLPRIKRSLSLVTGRDQAFPRQCFCKLSVLKLVFSVAKRKKLKFFFRQSLRVTHSLDVVCKGRAPPGTESDMWVKYVIHFYLYQILKIISLGFLRFLNSNGIHIFYTHVAHMNRDKCPDFGSLGIRECQLLQVLIPRTRYPAHRPQWASRFLSFFLLSYYIRPFLCRNQDVLGCGIVTPS